MPQPVGLLRCIALSLAVGALSGCRTGSLFGPRTSSPVAAAQQRSFDWLRRPGTSTRREPFSGSYPPRNRRDPLRSEVAWRPSPVELPPARPELPLATTSLETEVARWTATERLLLYPPAPARAWQYIVLHHSASEADSLETIDRFHREVRGWDGCGYHFVIGNGTYSGDGEIEVSRRWLEQKHGAHTKVAGHPEYNRYGIGICLVGNLEQHPPTEKQVAAARALVQYLMARYEIPPSRVTVHRVLAGGRTACPGRYFPTRSLLPRYWQ